MMQIHDAGALMALRNHAAQLSQRPMAMLQHAQQLPQLVSEHGNPSMAPSLMPMPQHGMMRTSALAHQQSPSPDAFAGQRLQQLQQMLGPTAYQSLMQQFQNYQGGGPDNRMGTASLWRQVSPVMGAMIQAQHGMTPQQNISGFSPQVQGLVQAVLARQQQANTPPQPQAGRPGAQLDY